MIKKPKIKVRQELKVIALPEDCDTMNDCEKALGQCRELMSKYKELDKVVPTTLFNRFVKLSLRLEHIFEMSKYKKVR